MDGMAKRALRIILQDRTVAYHPIIARVMGNAAGGIWLSQILYWDSVKAMTAEEEGKPFDGWFYKSEPELIEETALSRRECQTAKTEAKRLGIIEVQVKGLPPTSHYRVNFDVLERAIEQAHQSHTIVRLSARHCANKQHKSPSQIQADDAEITTETTRESGQKPPAPPEPPKAEKPAKAKADLFPVVTALSEVCQMPFEINRGRLFREAKQLCAAAVVPPVTPDEIRARYGAGGWWYREDWRGQKGEPPTPAAIRGTWGQWTVPKVIPFKLDTKAAKLADTFARWDAEAGNGNTTNHNGDPQEIFECVSFTVT